VIHRRALLLLAPLLTVVRADDKKKEEKPSDLEVVEATALRQARTIALDGRVRNSGQKTLEGVVLLFDFLATGRSVVTTQKAPLDDLVLEPGDESVYSMALKAPPRAVAFQINARDKRGRGLEVANPGPFPIE
jgi:hypothetical protein